MEKNELRCVIKYLQKKGMTPTEIHQDILNVLGEDAISYQVVKNWSRQFKLGRESCEQAKGAGPPQTVITQENINLVHDLILKDRRITIQFIADTLGMSAGSTEKILSEHLNLRKLSARWVPRMLLPDQKRIRVLTSKSNLMLFKADEDNFMARFVTVDETWVHHFDPESKQQSKEWRERGSAPPLKFRVVPSAGKLMATIFWDADGILLIDYLERGHTITGVYYAGLIKKLREVIKEKRRGKLTAGVLFHQDNAPAHKSHVAMAAISDAGFELLDHPAYSPDLAPSDFHLFTNLKKELRGTHYTDDNEVMHAVNSWLEGQPKKFYEQGIRDLKHRYEKCISVLGDYIEK
jgi:[histone H3]-lysine36 N-dimethyltransferase SETMAR